jgi:diguanylate cyclase (GGDEF)-like protein
VVIGHPVDPQTDVASLLELLAGGAPLAACLAAVNRYSELLHTDVVVVTVHWNDGPAVGIGSSGPADPELFPASLWEPVKHNSSSIDIDDLSELGPELHQWLAGRGIHSVRVGPVKQELHGQAVGCSIFWRTATERPRLVLEQANSVADRLTLLAILSDRVNRKLRIAAEHDPLTGLANRRTFDDRIVELVGAGGAILYVDLDDFKPVNDRFGHHVGDQVLMEVAYRISTCVRESDLVARIGGDEFGVICPRLSSSARAVEIANKVVDALREPMRVGENEVHLSASVGVAMAADGDDLGHAVRLADEAMYAAKSNGKGGVALAAIPTR